MGTLTVTNIINNVRSALNETSTTMLSDAELTIIINDGYKDICSKALAYEKKITKDNIATSQKIVSLVGENVCRVNYVEYKTGTTQGGKGLICILPQTVGHVPISTNAPQYWFQWGEYLIIEPLPDAATYDLAVYASCYPSAVLVATSADLPASDLPAEFHEDVYYFTLAFASLKLKRWADAASAYNQYIADIQNKRMQYITKPVDSRMSHELPDSVAREAQ
jgi:hypothetical protein